MKEHYVKAKTRGTSIINSNVVEVNIEVALRWVTEHTHDALLWSGVTVCFYGRKWRNAWIKLMSLLIHMQEQFVH